MILRLRMMRILLILQRLATLSTERGIFIPVSEPAELRVDLIALGEQDRNGLLLEFDCSLDGGHKNYLNHESEPILLRRTAASYAEDARKRFIFSTMPFLFRPHCWSEFFIGFVGLASSPRF